MYAHVSRSTRFVPRMSPLDGSYTTYLPFVYIYLQHLCCNCHRYTILYAVKFFQSRPSTVDVNVNISDPRGWSRERYCMHACIHASAYTSRRPAVNRQKSAAEVRQRSNSTCSICCGFVVQQVVRQIHNKSNKWSLGSIERKTLYTAIT
jgi:hypothetical protein